AVPLVFAVLLKLLLQPGLRVLVRARIPQPVAALVMIALLLAALGGLGYVLAAPGAAWLAKAPQSLPRIEQHLSVLKHPLARLMQTAREVQRMAESAGGGGTVAVQKTSLGDYLFSGTRALATGTFITVLLLFFLLAAGDLFMRKLVEILPSFRDK